MRSSCRCEETALFPTRARQRSQAAANPRPEEQVGLAAGDIGLQPVLPPLRLPKWAERGRTYRACRQNIAVVVTDDDDIGRGDAQLACGGAIFAAFSPGPAFTTSA